MGVVLFFYFLFIKFNIMMMVALRIVLLDLLGNVHVACLHPSVYRG